MQRTEPTSEARTERQFLTPLRAFAIAGVLLALFLGLWLAGQRTETDPNSSLSGGTAALTEEEVLVEFRELRTAYLNAYAHGDPTLAQTVLSSDATSLRRSTKEIERLNELNYVDKTLFKTISTAVVKSAVDRVEIRERVDVYPKYIDRSTGKNVTGERVPQRQTIAWTVVQEAGDWKLLSAKVVSSVPVEDRPS